MAKSSVELSVRSVRQQGERRDALEAGAGRRLQGTGLQSTQGTAGHCNVAPNRILGVCNFGTDGPEERVECKPGGEA